MLQTAVITFTLLLCLPVKAQLILEIASLPPQTPQDAILYIAGSFNNWNPADPAFRMEERDGKFILSFQPQPGPLEFKCTRGSWETVEGNAHGGFVPNHQATYEGGKQTTAIHIEGWEDLKSGHSPTTAAVNVLLLDDAFYMPQLDRSRKIWIYLPPDYAESKKRYPVLYMHDGQNLFDRYTSAAGEWQVDESLNELLGQGDYGCIVVGIENGRQLRITEYSAWSHPKYGGGEGQAYAAFIKETLKPHIDSAYRTLADRSYTAIAGSSMGANISMYAAIAYPEVFGHAGIFSPAFWFSDSTYQQAMNQSFEPDIQVYFLAGENESQTMTQDMLQMYFALHRSGNEQESMYFSTSSEGQHSEWFWAQEFPAFYHWLWSDQIMMVNAPNQRYYVIPSDNRKSLYTTFDQPGFTLSAYTMSGKKVWEGKPGRDGAVSTAQLNTGNYYLAVNDPGKKIISIHRYYQP